MVYIRFWDLEPHGSRELRISLTYPLLYIKIKSFEIFRVTIDVAKVDSETMHEGRASCVGAVCYH